MSDRRAFRWATTSVRLLVGTLVSVAFVVAVVTAVAAPWPTIAHEPLKVEATPAPSASVVSCTGGLLMLGRQAGSASQLAVAAPQGTTAGSVDGSSRPAESELSVSGVPESSPMVFTVPPERGERADVAASGSAVVSAEDLRGFAASACHPALMESWLVGGASTTGAADLVLLANPGVVPATVQLTVYGTGGAQVPPGGDAVVVAAGTQTVIPLAGLAPGQESPVVRVTSMGAPIQASLQTSLTRTLLPVGVDQITAIAAPEQTVTIPGVAVTVAPGAEGASDAATVVRMLSPDADAAATVTVTLVGGTDPVVEPSVVPLTAGLPSEIQLGGLPVGQYVVQVEAESPLVAAVWQSAGSGEAADFAWYSAAPTLDGPTLFATPAGPEGVLTILNSGPRPATVTVTSVDGDRPQSVTIAPGEAGTLKLASQSVFRLDPGEGAGALRAGLSFAGDGALAAFPVWPSDAAAAPIVVYP